MTTSDTEPDNDGDQLDALRELVSHLFDTTEDTEGQPA